MTPVRPISLVYERRSVPELLSILEAHSISCLIDVRELPISRRRGFNKAALSTALLTSGVRYSHVRAAGNPYRKAKRDIA